MLQDERRVKVLDKRLPGSLEHSEGDWLHSTYHADGHTCQEAKNPILLRSSGQTFLVWSRVVVKLFWSGLE